MKHAGLSTKFFNMAATSQLFWVGWVPQGQQNFAGDD